MDEQLKRVRKPRCYLVYALAPDNLSTAEANRVFNQYLADRNLPLPLIHDHFIARPGGFAIFYVQNSKQRDALLSGGILDGWRVKIHALIYSESPAGLNEQIAFTLRAYRGLDWEDLQREERPASGGSDRDIQHGEKD